MKEALDRLQTILLAAPLPTIAIDGSGRIELFSEAAAEVFGIPREDFIKGE